MARGPCGHPFSGGGLVVKQEPLNPALGDVVDAQPRVGHTRATRANADRKSTRGEFKLFVYVPGGFSCGGMIGRWLVS